MGPVGMCLVSLLMLREVLGCKQPYHKPAPPYQHLINTYSNRSLFVGRAVGFAYLDTRAFSEGALGISLQIMDLVWLVDVVVHFRTAHGPLDREQACS